MSKNKYSEIVRHLKGIREVVINSCHGGFSLSEQAEARYKELAGIIDPNWTSMDIDRSDLFLIKTIKELGVDQASGTYAQLKIVEIPQEVEWTVMEYDGLEWVAEKHRTWS